MFRRLDKVQNKKVWRLPIILLAELIGTFLMVFEIIAPSALNLSANTVWYDKIFGTFFMKAFWVAGFILILILLLRWISVNLNPAVTLAEMAVGNTSKQQGAWMIAIQFVGAFLAAYAGYWMGTHMDVFNGAGTLATSTAAWVDGQSTLDAVYPILKLSQNEVEWLSATNNLLVAFPGVTGTLDATTGAWTPDAGIFTLWTQGVNGFALNSTAWAFIAITFALETIYTWLLLWSIVGARKVSNGARPFLIFLVLMLVVTLGIHTNNVALNPARLIAPAVVSQLMGGAHTLQYVLIFLAGELLAVLLVARTAGKREYKAAVKGGVVAGTVTGNDEIFKSEVKVGVLAIRNDVEGTKGRYKWVLDGNAPIESMTKEELESAITKAKADKVINTSLDLKEVKKEFSLFLGLGAAGYKSAKKELEDAISNHNDLIANEKAKASKKNSKKEESKEETAKEETAKKAAPTKKAAKKK